MGQFDLEFCRSIVVTFCSVFHFEFWFTYICYGIKRGLINFTPCMHFGTGNMLRYAEEQTVRSHLLSSSNGLLYIIFVKILFFVHFRDDFDVANRSGSVMKADSDEVISFTDDKLTIFVSCKYTI